jgi:hypothetical protein
MQTLNEVCSVKSLVETDYVYQRSDNRHIIGRCFFQWDKDQLYKDHQNKSNDHTIEKEMYVCNAIT